MNTQELNKAVFRRYNDAVNNQDAETMRSLVTPDSVIYYDNEPMSHEKMLQREVGGWKTIKGGRVEILDLIAEGDRVACRMMRTITGPDGKTTKLFYSAFWRLEDGKCAESWHDLRKPHEC